MEWASSLEAMTSGSLDRFFCAYYFVGTSLLCIYAWLSVIIQRKAVVWDLHPWKDTFPSSGFYCSVNNAHFGWRVTQIQEPMSIGGKYWIGVVNLGGYERQVVGRWSLGNHWNGGAEGDGKANSVDKVVFRNRLIQFYIVLRSSNFTELFLVLLCYYVNKVRALAEE